MSYGIVRVQKMTAGSVKGIEIHDLREKSNSHTNPDIDFDKSDRNYDLCPSQNANFYQAVKERIDSLNLPKAVRKDAIVMGQVLVTSDSDFFQKLAEQTENSIAERSHVAYASGEPFSESCFGDLHTDFTREFFQRAYDFLADRYGHENVVSSVVHLDEKGSPHMHFNFVPVTEDGRLCAKEVFSRARLIEQQDTFFEQVGKDYGLLRGEPKEKGKRRKHLETAEFKEAMQMVHEAEEKLSEARESVSGVEVRVNALQEQEIALQGKIEGLQRDLADLQAEVSDLQEEKSGLERVVAQLREYEQSIRQAIEKLMRGNGATMEQIKGQIRIERALEFIEKIGEKGRFEQFCDAPQSFFQRVKDKVKRSVQEK